MVNHIGAHVLVSGHVQGVYFRATTHEVAKEQGVNGWVRNREDGRVEAVFEGPESDVQAMVEFCRNGSEAAVVEDITVDYRESEGLEGFQIRR